MTDSSEIAVAGAAAALVVDVFFYPLDTIKTRMQASSTIAKPFEFKGLYNGVGSVILSTLPASALFFLAYENAKSELSKYVNAPTAQLTASILGELLACSAIAPADTIKQRAQIQGNQLSSFQVAKIVFSQKSAWSDIKSGYKAVVLRNLPVTAAYFPLYEWLREKIEKDFEMSKPNAALFAGGFAAMPLAVITTPLDVVKTRIMLGQGIDSNRKGVFSVGLHISKTEGIRTLFKSGMLRGLGAAVGAGIELGCYEYTRKYFKLYTEQ